MSWFGSYRGICEGQLFFKWCNLSGTEEVWMIPEIQIWPEMVSKNSSSVVMLYKHYISMI